MHFSSSNAGCHDLSGYFALCLCTCYRMERGTGSVFIYRCWLLQLVYDEIAIDALIHLLKPRWRMLSTVISTLIGVVFLCFLLVYSIDLVKTGANNLSVGLGVPMSIPYLCLPIGTVLMILTSVEVIFKQVRDFRKGGKEE